MTGSTFAPEPHQKLIDGLTAMVLTGDMEKSEAQDLIAWYQRQFPLSDAIDMAVLFQIGKERGLEQTRPEARYEAMSSSELEERLGEISYELRPVTLPFRSFGDYQREQKLGLEAGYIEDELQRRS